MWFSGLMIQPGHCSGSGCCCGLRFDPQPWNFPMPWVQPKKKKKKKKEETQEGGEERRKIPSEIRKKERENPTAIPLDLLVQGRDAGSGAQVSWRNLDRHADL